MKKEKNLIRFSTLALLTAIAASYRIIPHPWNFSPVGAIALFGGAYYGSKYTSVLLPLLMVWISDVIINNVLYAAYFPQFTLFYEGFYWVYGSFILLVAIGWLLKGKVTIWSVPLASVIGSVLFFLITNFGVWASYTTYPKTFAGLIACYIAGLPYFTNTLVGDISFCVVLFGSFEVLQRYFPSLALSRVNPD